MEENKQEQLKYRQQLEMLENVAKQNMTGEAVSRYGNIKAAHPEKAMHVASMIVQMIQDGKLTSLVDDNLLKTLLLQISPQKKEFNMVRK